MARSPATRWPGQSTLASTEPPNSPRSAIGISYSHEWADRRQALLRLSKFLEPVLHHVHRQGRFISGLYQNEESLSVRGGIKLQKTRKSVLKQHRRHREPKRIARSHFCSHELVTAGVIQLPAVSPPPG